MKKFIALVIALLLISCAQKEDKKQDSADAPFVGGVEGLAITVLDGAPPSVITDLGTSTFSVVLTLEAVGESNVGEGTENPFVSARLAALFPKSFGLTENDLFQLVPDRLRGARKNFDGTILPGEITAVSFQPITYLPAVLGSELLTIHAETCYDYSTHSTLKVCIKDDTREFYEDDTVCQLRDNLLPQNSGAPLQVVSAEQHPRGVNKIQVNFEVQNLGRGVFFNRNDNSKDACDFRLENSDLYEALIVVHPVDADNHVLDCRGLDDTKEGFESVPTPDPRTAEYGVVRFRRSIPESGEVSSFRTGDSPNFALNSPRSFTCFLDKTTDTEGRIFQEIMNIDIYYRYGDFIEIPILVQEAAGYIGGSGTGANAVPRGGGRGG